jgi:hypothetical protein
MRLVDAEVFVFDSTCEVAEVDSNPFENVAYKASKMIFASLEI